MKMWRSLTAEYLHLSFAATSDADAVIYERPGLWMKQNALEGLLGDMKKIAGKTISQNELEYGVLGGDKARLNACIITLIRDRSTGEPIAFNALSWIPLALHGESLDLLHLGLVMVDPEAHSKGFSWVLYGLTCFLFFLRGGLRPVWISNVTQVPAIVGIVGKTFSSVHPGDARSSPAYDHVALARQIMTEHRYVFGVGEGAEFDEDHFIIRNAYTGGSDALKKTFAECQKHRDSDVNRFCEDHLNYERGDDFLQIGQLSLTSARSYLFRQIPRRSLRALTAAFCLLLLQSLLLPVAHWLNSKRSYANLRPRPSR